MKMLEGHPNIVNPIAFFPDKEKGIGYMVMELIEGNHIMDIVAC